MDTPVALIEALADRYRLDRQLGAGGMATVYLARDVKHDREVAIKVLHPDLAETLGRERFLREIQLAARLNHPNILPLYDSGEASGCMYFVMPVMAGQTLRDRLSSGSPLPVDEAVRIAMEVADALAIRTGDRHGGRWRGRSGWSPPVCCCGRPAGIYALMSFTVAQRTREIGIRTALGAQPLRLMLNVFGRAGWQIAAGVLVGSILSGGAFAAIGLGLLRAAPLLLAVAVMMGFVGLMAAFGPARRASRIQASEALRADA